MKIQIILSTAALLLSTGAGMAETTDMLARQRAEFYAPGKHQFYAWCPSGQDRIVQQGGASAKDAQARLLQGQANCRLSWQGRVRS